MSSSEPDALASEAGLSLIELIVAMIVSIIVLVGVATILINSLLTQNQVLSMTEATNRGQLISTQIERAMRNAAYFEVSPDGAALMVRTTFTGERRCQAFLLGDGVAQMKMDELEVEVADWGTWLDAEQYPRFEVSVQVPAAGAFTAAGDTLRYDFSVETDSAPVYFSGESSYRLPAAARTRGIVDPTDPDGGCWS